MDCCGRVAVRSNSAQQAVELGAGRLGGSCGELVLER
jgi:hypothetical protein